MSDCERLRRRFGSPARGHVQRHEYRRGRRRSTEVFYSRVGTRRQQEGAFYYRLFCYYQLAELTDRTYSKSVSVHCFQK